MATEEFKETMLKLFENYISLRAKMKSEGYENINLSFRDYLNAYLENKSNNIWLDDGEEDEDETSEEIYANMKD